MTSDTDLPPGVYRCYRPLSDKTRDETIKTIHKVNALLKKYEGVVSLRQMYYQFVSRNWIANDDREYKRLGKIIEKGRMAGLISWTAFEDRNRGLMGLRRFEGPRSAFENMRETFRIDMWRNQPMRAEVWVEKAALEGVVGQICDELRVDYMALRGYNSASEMYEAAQRYKGYANEGQRVIIFHLGDHDPSGIDMTRDNRERMELMVGAPIMLQRLALNWNQIEEFNPPPNPAKVTDSRFNAYEEQFGTRSSWELDSLEPTVIQGMIEDAIMRVRDDRLWDEMLAQEAHDIDFIDDTIDLAFPKLKEEPHVED